MNETTKKLGEILDTMLNEERYDGINALEAKNNAIIAITDLIAEINNNYKNQPTI